MRPLDLKSARQEKGWSQAEAATRLNVAQSYVAMLENGRRPVTPRLARKATSVFGLSPTALPPSKGWETALENGANSKVLAEELAALGYPGFAYLGSRRWRRQPAEVLLTALGQNKLEARVTEALPWLVLRYWDMNKDWLVEHAKRHDLQNRLGFVVGLAGQVAERTKPADDPARFVLKDLWETLDKSRLARMDTLGKADLTDAEQRWLMQNRTEEAKHWNLLTDWRAEVLPYAG
jgi:transcriptional regulator with XRE-family HTH domain